jgi:hypothetical protein
LFLVYLDKLVLNTRDAIRRRERERELDEKFQLKEDQLRREREKKEEERQRLLEEQARLDIERKEKLKGGVFFFFIRLT